MASLKQKITKVLQQEFVPGKIYRVDMDRVDVQPVGSTGILRSLELVGDRDKLKPGDPIKIITVGGKRLAMSLDVAVDTALEGGSTVVLSSDGNSGSSEPGTGDMEKAVYDPDNDGIVEQADDADTLDGLHATAFASADHTHPGGSGDMEKATYDPDDDGSVEQADNADTLDGQHAADFALVGHTHTAPVLQAIFTIAGDLTVATGNLRIYNATGQTKTISKVFLSVSAAPTGAPIIVDVNMNGASIFTTQANRPQIAAGAETGYSATIDVTSWADGSYLTVDTDQIGSTIAGSNLTVHIVYS